MNALLVDRLGNNMLIECTACNAPFIVGSPPIYNKPRKCPHCEKTQAYADGQGGVIIEPVDDDGE